MANRENDKQLIKALYKYMLENYKKSAKDKNVAQQVVADVLDPNHEAEVDPDKIPSPKSSVMSKAKKGKMGKGDLPLSGGTASNPVSRPDAGFGAVVVKNNEQEVPKAPKAKKPVKLPSKVRVKGVKRLKSYVQGKKKG